MRTEEWGIGLEWLHNQIDFLTPRSSLAFEGVVEVSDQVPHVFDAARQANHPIGNAQRIAPVRRHRGVRHRGGMADETLDSSQRFCERKDSRSLEDPSCSLFTPHFDGDHPAESTHLAAGKLVLRM